MTQKQIDHQHYTTASLKERILLDEFDKANPGLFTSIIYSDPEGADSWDAIFILSGETKQRLVETKVRTGISTWNGYTIEEPKYKALMLSAFTYTITYINFFSDNNLLLWNVSDTRPDFKQELYQNNNKENKPKYKICADLPTTAATRYNTSYSIDKAQEKAENEYKKRLQKDHPKKWKRI